MGDRIRQSVIETVRQLIPEYNRDQTTSIGIVQLNQEDLKEDNKTTINELDKKAEHILYQIKENGRNQVLIYGGSTQTAQVLST